MKRFANLPDKDRLRIRTELEKCGASCVAYSGPFAQFYMPRLPELRQLFREECKKEHLSILEDTYYFPIGTDNVPKFQRHDGNYPGSRGFVLIWQVIPDNCWEIER